MDRRKFLKNAASLAAGTWLSKGAGSALVPDFGPSKVKFLTCDTEFDKVTVWSNGVEIDGEVFSRLEAQGYRIFIRGSLAVRSEDHPNGVGDGVISSGGFTIIGGAPRQR